MKPKKTMDQKRRSSPKRSITLSKESDDKLINFAKRTGKSISRIIDEVVTGAPLIY